MRSPHQAVIVTGASQGIGAGIVKAYRKAGYGVVATSRAITPSDDPEVVVVRGDLADPDTAERVVSAALNRFGRIDTLVNNAGMFIAKPFVLSTADELAQIISVNLTGFFHMSQRVLVQMQKQGSGHIVTITTTLVDKALSAVPSALASLTKGGLDAATRSLAIEYAGTGIRVNAVSPGIIKTPMHPVGAHDALAALHPIGRMGEIQEVAEAVLYLEGAHFVTGEVLHVDGGQCAGH